MTDQTPSIGIRVSVIAMSSPNVNTPSCPAPRPWGGDGPVSSGRPVATGPCGRALASAAPRGTTPAGLPTARLHAPVARERRSAARGVAAISFRVTDRPRKWLRQLARSLRGGTRQAAPRPLRAPRLAYRDLLVRSLFCPVLSPPYDRQDLYFMALLDSFAAQLAARHRERPPASLISLVMPVLEGSRWLRATIDSVRAQSHASWELVIVDAEPRRRHRPHRRTVRRPAGSGCCVATTCRAARARNAALEVVRGELIAYVEAGDTLDADFLLVLGGEFEDDAGVDMVYAAERGLERSDGEASRPVFASRPSTGRRSRTATISASVPSCTGARCSTATAGSTRAWATGTTGSSSCAARRRRRHGRSRRCSATATA